MKYTAVYLLVEPTRFKIGWSVDPIARARSVTPAVIWEKSSAIYFTERRAATDCEKVLHKLFGKWREQPCAQDGGTEFFALECLDDVELFISQHKHLLGYHGIERGIVTPSPAEPVRFWHKKPRSGWGILEERTRRIQANAATINRIIDALALLQAQGCELCRHAMRDDIFFIAFCGEAQEGLVMRLRGGDEVVPIHHFGSTSFFGEVHCWTDIGIARVSLYANRYARDEEHDICARAMRVIKSLPRLDTTTSDGLDVEADGSLRGLFESLGAPEDA